MKNYMINSLMFVAGVAIGSVVTWKFTKTKYERIAQEEIDSVKEVFANRQKQNEEKIKMAEVAKEKPDLAEYAQKLKETNYTNYSEANKEEEGESAIVIKPYVISADDFGEGNYSIEHLTYYSDEVLTNDWDEVVEDVENVVGTDFPNHFDEEFSVYVRNDRLETDYEILLDMRNYSDIVRNPQHLVEDYDD